MIRLEGDGHFEVDVKGESRYQDNLQAICGKRTEDGEDRTLDAILVLDDGNPYDPQAVRVEIQGRTVGYLARDAAPGFRDLVAQAGYHDREFVCWANIRGGWQRGGNLGRYGVWLDLPRQLPISQPPEVAPAKVAPAPQSRKPRRWGKIFLILLLVLIGAFIACILFGLLLQALGVA